MKRSSIPFVVFLIIGSLLLFSGRKQAFCNGYIELVKEPGGDIYKEGSSTPDNPNGAMVWNGSDWVVNYNANKCTCPVYGT